MSSESSSLLDPEQDEQETKEQFDGRWNKGLKKINLIQDTLKKYEELSSLSKDFVHTAELYAKVFSSLSIFSFLDSLFLFFFSLFIQIFNHFIRSSFQSYIFQHQDVLSFL